MIDLATAFPDAILIGGDTLRIQRRLRGPIDRAFAFLTDSDLRRQWLAAGELPSRVGETFTLTWRHDELAGKVGARPEGFPEEHSMESRLLTLDPPRELAFTWGDEGRVSIALEEQDGEVLLTLEHQRLAADRSTRIGILAGWHAHLDILAALANDREPEPFWAHWAALKQHYGERFAD